MVYGWSQEGCWCCENSLLPRQSGSHVHFACASTQTFKVSLKQNTGAAVKSHACGFSSLSRFICADSGDVRDIPGPSIGIGHVAGNHRKLQKTCYVGQIQTTYAKIWIYACFENDQRLQVWRPYLRVACADRKSMYLIRYICVFSETNICDWLNKSACFGFIFFHVILRMPSCWFF